ncbi:MAG: hypothetical protein L3J07_02560 [Candidatus Magasanikbacteria bacterium]|nr:hypothetical protein [Candidatus Magasanikbacteria bacterium]
MRKYAQIFILFCVMFFCVSSVYAFTNDELAGTALSYDTENVYPFECKGFVQQVINQELGATLGTGYCQAYLDLGSEVSGGITNAQLGDVIQINTSSGYESCSAYNNTTFVTGMHTAIFFWKTLVVALSE